MTEREGRRPSRRTAAAGGLASAALAAALTAGINLRLGHVAPNFLQGQVATISYLIHGGGSASERIARSAAPLAKLVPDMGRTFATGLPPLRGFGGSRRPLPLSRTSCPAGRSSPARPARVRRSCSVTVCSVLHRLQRHRCSAPTPRQGQHPQGPHRGRPRRASRTLCSPVRPRNGRPNGLPGCFARPCAPLLRCLLRERGAARWLTCSLRRDYRPLAMVGA